MSYSLQGVPAKLNLTNWRTHAKLAFYEFHHCSAYRPACLENKNGEEQILRDTVSCYQNHIGKEEFGCRVVFAFTGSGHARCCDV